jgi:glycine/D-amino acid oxidase-like deaminating enzyme
MPNPILKQAVVVGAGMGGLTAAKAIAPHFERVIVFDRDALPDAPAPRPGTPQARHTHGLLAGGHRASNVCFPASSSISSRPALFGCAFGATCASRRPASILSRNATSASINSACRAPRSSASAVAESNGSGISSSDRERA